MDGNVCFKLRQWCHHLVFLLGAAALGVILTACRTHWDITTTNGTVIRSYDKPKLNDHGYYVFKDISGQPQEINKMRVRQIEPVRPGSPPSSDASFFLQH
jgi:hypothetical protein